MNYTQEELDLIKEAFQVVRIDFPEDLSVENQSHVIKSLLRYKNKYHMNDIKIEKTFKLFEKLGFWQDGITTLTERTASLFAQKIEFEKRIRELNQKRTETYEVYAKKTQEAIQTIQNLPTQLQSEMEKQGKIILQTVESDIEKITKLQENEILRYITLYTNKIQEEGTKIFKKAQDTLSRIKRNKLIEIQDNIERQEQALTKEFEVIQTYKGGTNELDFLKTEINKIESEVKYNEELFKSGVVEIPVGKDYNIYTVAQLLKIVEDKKIELPNGVRRKADLIQAIKKSEVSSTS